MAEFKKVKSKAFRRRKHSESSEEDSEKESDVTDVVEDLRELQKLRKRKKGVDVEDLAAAKLTQKKDAPAERDPYKLKVGGIIDLQKIQRGESIDDDEAIGTSFAAETNRRDEDADMLKYVDLEMAKRKGLVDDKEKQAEKIKNPEDNLYAIPDHLKVQSTKKHTEDMLSNQMLSGIPEVDLGLDAKIKNLEATEEAKQKLLQDRMRQKKKEVSDFVPTNMAVNFMQHNRFNIEDTVPILPKIEEPVKQKVLRVGDADDTSKKDKSKLEGERSTDDYHFEKYKKHSRR
ncbi:unnamed protein product [Owenia fusiformis]|uniref:Uncharacterized protein n=1 Tax=Owenia fusiformis TaxID=6347 RepID=A0A8J1TYE8_OWEFU|nr:unnamed protein product [Owenia fusiformis]